jgi:hypothetical protein
MVIDKESVYDEEISPLVQQTIEICRAVPIGRVDAPPPRGSML